MNTATKTLPIRNGAPIGGCGKPASRNGAIVIAAIAHAAGRN